MILVYGTVTLETARVQNRQHKHACMGQSLDQLIDQLINQSINQSAIDRLSIPINQSMGHQIYK